MNVVLLEEYFLYQIHDSNACAAKLYVLIAGIHDRRHGLKILADELSEYTTPCAVENAYTGDTHLCGIIDEMLHGVEGFVTPHSAHIDVLTEVE